MGLSSPGIGSNLDVKGFVSQLMAVESQPLTALSKKEASYLAKVSAFGSLKGSLSSFQSALDALRSPAKFQGATATASDSTILSATATNKAVPGTYSVAVTQLAQAQTIATAGQASSTTPLGDGAKTTISIQFGTISGGKLSSGVYVNDPTASQPNPTFTQNPDQAGGSIVIDSTNNSLQGISDAINKANLGVTATVVSDGSATPQHLVLTSNNTGLKQSMKITVARDPAAPVDNTLSNLLAYDPAGTQNMTQSSAAQNTALTVNGIAVTSSSTSVSEAIQGVTLTVSKIGASSVTVARDTNAIQNGINSLVKAYNDLDKTIKSLTAYDAATKTSGPLLGDSSVRGVQSQIRTMLGQPIDGAAGAFNNLTQIGVTFQKDGTLAVDSTKLTSVMTSNFNDIAGLFASVGTSTDSLVNFSGSTDSTLPGSAPLTISALATRGNVTGSAAPASLTITAGVNDQLSLSVDGISTSVTIAPATYTSASLAAALQAKINGAAELTAAGSSVNVRANANGSLTIESNRYGSASNVTVGGTASNNLFPSPSQTSGTDVAGTIGGVAGSGSGQFLTAGAGSNLAGLKLEVTGGAPSARGTVSYSRGYAEQLSKLIDQFTGSDGLITGQTDSLQRSITDIGNSRDALNVRLAATQQRYLAQFTALDVAVGQMSQTSSYLTQQLAKLSTISG